MLGLDASRFPGFQKKNPVLLEQERKKLSNLESHEKTGQNRTYQLSQLLASTTGKVYLSYPCFDTAENREIAPAPYMLQIYRLRE